MKKLLVFILCLGLTFAIGACGLTGDGTESNSGTENSESINDSGNSSGNSSDTTDNSSDDSSNDSSGDSSNDNSGESSDDSSTVTPPIIDGDNEMPLVPIG